MSDQSTTWQRHASTRQLLRWFSFQHLPKGQPRDVSELMGRTAMEVILLLRDGPELNAGLRHLLEAKDCFVRQAITDGETPAV